MQLEIFRSLMSVMIMSGITLLTMSPPTARAEDISPAEQITAFRLKHGEGSAAEADFLRAVGALGSIPGVEAFELIREGTAEAAQSAGPGIAPSASLSRVLTFMLTTTPTISSTSSGPKCSTSASWKRWNALSRSVSAARVSASA